MIFERLSTHRAIKGCFYYTNIERKIIMDGKAIEIVRDYIGEHLDKSDTKPDFEVYTVWKCKVLQNWKYLPFKHSF